MVPKGFVGVWLSLLGVGHVLPSLSIYQTGLGGGVPFYLLGHQPLHATSSKLEGPIKPSSQNALLLGPIGLVQCLSGTQHWGSLLVGSLRLRQATDTCRS